VTDRLIPAEVVWQAVLDIAAATAAGRALPPALPLGGGGAVLETADGSVRGGRPDDAARDLAALFLPVCRGGPGRPVTIAQIGQSLDGRIATAGGLSHYITGEANLIHLHRLRALVQAVVVGCATVRHDDPRLTTRRVPGPNPVRVVIDARRSLGPEYHVFGDGAAPTLLLCADGRAAAAGARHGLAEVVPLPCDAAGRLAPAAILAALHRRGLYRVLVEGGGLTISRFLQAGALDRLHVAVAPLLIGSGRPAITLPEIDTLDHALRPRCRHFAMGDDMLFDCDLTPAPV
jgi:riboflavin-specific deaminase-like protein